MVLACIDRHANTYGRYIKPLVSIQVDFYVRRVDQTQDVVSQVVRGGGDVVFVGLLKLSLVAATLRRSAFLCACTHLRKW